MKILKNLSKSKLEMKLRKFCFKMNRGERLGINCVHERTMSCGVRETWRM